MRCPQGHYVGDIDPTDACPTCEAEGGSPDPWELAGLELDSHDRDEDDRILADHAYRARERS